MEEPARKNERMAKFEVDFPCVKPSSISSQVLSLEEGETESGIEPALSGKQASTQSMSDSMAAEVIVNTAESTELEKLRRAVANVVHSASEISRDSDSLRKAVREHPPLASSTSALGASSSLASLSSMLNSSRNMLSPGRFSRSPCRSSADENETIDDRESWDTRSMPGSYVSSSPAPSADEDSAISTAILEKLKTSELAYLAAFTPDNQCDPPFPMQTAHESLSSVPMVNTSTSVHNASSAYTDQEASSPQAQGPSMQKLKRYRRNEKEIEESVLKANGIQLTHGVKRKRTISSYDGYNQRRNNSKKFKSSEKEKIRD